MKRELLQKMHAELTLAMSQIASIRNKPPTIIIAGVTRSGLTMTMQMLAAGGFPCAGEYPDFEPYPMGYVPWHQLYGQAVKCVDTHRQFPPEGCYRVIRLRRDYREQAKSINKFCSAMFGFPESDPSVIASIKRDLKIIDRWAERQNGRMLLDFEQILANPFLQATRVAAFVEHKLDIAEMVRAVIKRSPQCYPGFLENDMIRKGGES